MADLPQMDTELFARTLLFGTRLEEKLVEARVGDHPTASSPLDVPNFPGRPLRLSKSGKASFPALHRLHEPSVRGEILHFFANHELLAMELMALMLLRFPEAPADFRKGVVRTIQEEQSHLQLYLSRMKELGVEFGDLPVSDYFWNAMKSMSSPMDFVVQMSLTFEQANLDFSLFFMKEIQKSGDEQTAAVLERVYREEIGHVKHGLAWFNRWRPEGESDWEAYLRLLPPPMTARRAKGHEFSHQARREAGLSEHFIRELSLFTGSKGRPPVVWIYNSHCESEIARGVAGFNPTEGAKRLSQDLECLPAFLAQDQDVVLVAQRPSTEWIAELQAAGFQTPEFSVEVKAPKVGGLEPWGWSPEVFTQFKVLRNRVVEMDGGNGDWAKELLGRNDFSETGLGKLYSKSWSVRFLREWVLKKSPRLEFCDPEILSEIIRDPKLCRLKVGQALALSQKVMLKAPYGTSGMAVREVRALAELDGPLGGWVNNVISSQGEMIFERFLDKQTDLSVQLEIEDGKTRVLETRKFLNGTRNEYRGTLLGKGAFSAEEARFLHSVMEPWQEMLRDLGQKLREEGYRGPAGVDAMIWRESQTHVLKFKPLVELNPRWTMGRVALELETKIAPGVPAEWKFISKKRVLEKGFLGFCEFAEEMRGKFPIHLVRAGGGSRIERGWLFTNDPRIAKEVLTVLIAGSSQELLPENLL